MDVEQHRRPAGLSLRIPRGGTDTGCFGGLGRLVRFRRPVTARLLRFQVLRTRGKVFIMIGHCGCDCRWCSCVCVWSTLVFGVCKKNNAKFVSVIYALRPRDRKVNCEPMPSVMLAVAPTKALVKIHVKAEGGNKSLHHHQAMWHEAHAELWIVKFYNCSGYKLCAACRKHCPQMAADDDTDGRPEPTCAREGHREGACKRQL